MTQSITTINRNTVSEQKKSFYFDRKLQSDAKDKLDFREKFDSEEAKKRCLDIWHEFSEDKTTGSPA